MEMIARELFTSTSPTLAFFILLQIDDDGQPQPTIFSRIRRRRRALMSPLMRLPRVLGSSAADQNAARLPMASGSNAATIRKAGRQSPPTRVRVLTRRARNSFHSYFFSGWTPRLLDPAVRHQLGAGTTVSIADCLSICHHIKRE